MRNFIICCLLFFLMGSCVIITPPRSIKRNFTNCYDGKPTGIEKVLKVDGYYSLGSNIVVNFILYRDGSMVYEFFDYSGNIQKYFQEINSDTNKKKDFEKEFYWGKYIIVGDTIKMQWINHPAPLAATWMAWEEVYKIKNDTTLQFVFERNLEPNEEKKYIEKNGKRTENIGLNAKFTRTEERPDSINWLKNQKWFYCKNINR